MVRFLVLAAAFLIASSSASSAQSLDRIAATKLLHIGFIDGEAPFSSKGQGGPPSGYAIDLCNEIQKAVALQVPDVKAVYVETTLADAFHDVVSGKIDLLCGAITASLSRRELVDFSQPIFISGITALLRRDSPADVRSLVLEERQVSPPRSPMLRAFATHTFGVRAGSTAESILRKVMQIEGYGATILQYDNHEAGIAALEAKQIDAYFADRALLIELLRNDRSTAGLEIADRWFTHEPYGIALGRGDWAFRLLIDRTLSKFYASPAYLDLCRKYFGGLAPTISNTIRMQSLPE